MVNWRGLIAVLQVGVQFPKKATVKKICADQSRFQRLFAIFGPAKNSQYLKRRWRDILRAFQTISRDIKNFHRKLPILKGNLRPSSPQSLYFHLLLSFLSLFPPLSHLISCPDGRGNGGDCSAILLDQEELPFLWYHAIP